MDEALAAGLELLLPAGEELPLEGIHEGLDLGFDPLDFDIEFPPPPSPDGSPLERWIVNYRLLLFIIRLFM